MSNIRLKISFHHAALLKTKELKLGQHVERIVP